MNCREIDKVLEELHLEGAFIQAIHDAGYDQIILTTYKEQKIQQIFICIKPQAERIHSITVPFKKKPAPLQRFTQLLRSRILRGTITRVEQINQDRLICFEITRKKVKSLLWVRLWTHASNVILTDAQGRIDDALLRKPQKQEVSGAIFVPPPKRPQSPPLESFPLTLSSRPYNRALEEFYDTTQKNVEEKKFQKTFERLCEEKIHSLSERLQKNKAVYEELQKQEDVALWARKLEEYLHQIPKSFSNQWHIDDPHTQTSMIIPLNPEKSLYENIQDYYQQARQKRKRTQRVLDEQATLYQAQEELLSTIQRLKENPAEQLAWIKTQEKNLDSPPSQRFKKVFKPGVSFFHQGFYFFFGRNVRENESLLRQHSRGNDLWFHAREEKGAYVFLRAPKEKSVPLEVLLDAAHIALYHSKGAQRSSAEVVYTSVKYLKKPRKAAPGRVLVSQEKTLIITLDKERVIQLLKKDAQ